MSKKEDELHQWAKERDEMFLGIEDDGIQVRVAEILDRFPKLVDVRKNRSTADPFVIAVASLEDPPLVVVTQEVPTGNHDKPKIPDVCAEEGLSCISVLDMIVRENWRL